VLPLSKKQVSLISKQEVDILYYSRASSGWWHEIPESWKLRVGSRISENVCTNIDLNSLNFLSY